MSAEFIRIFTGIYRLSDIQSIQLILENKNEFVLDIKLRSTFDHGRIEMKDFPEFKKEMIFDLLDEITGRLNEYYEDEDEN